MTIFNVPIEPFEWRYSQQWNNWFPMCFRAFGKSVYTICPESPYKKIQHGSFLDVVGTNLFKAKQLETICRLFQKGKVKDGDTFFFHDIWFPGIQMLAYIRDGLGIDCKIFGCLHAGCYDPHDFLAKHDMGTWGEDFEKSVLLLTDGIFVATNFHKNMLVDSFGEILTNHVHVTGFPIYENEYKFYDKSKEDIIVFPHRLDEEKQPKMFDALEKWIKKYLSEFRFIKSSEVCSTKQEYLELIGKAQVAVSFAKQETWGIAMQEAVFCGCLPLVPDRLSYTEMYLPEFRYGLVFEVEEKLRYMLLYSERFVLAYEEQKRILSEKGKAAIPKMLAIIEEKVGLV